MTNNKTTMLRIPASYEAKIAKICNFWTFRPVIMNGPSAFLLLNIFDGETQLSLWADNPQYCDPTLGILTLFSPKSYILNSLLQCTEATEAHFWSAEFKKMVY